MFPKIYYSVIPTKLATLNCIYNRTFLFYYWARTQDREKKSALMSKRKLEFLTLWKEVFISFCPVILNIKHGTTFSSYLVSHFKPTMKFVWFSPCDFIIISSHCWFLCYFWCWYTVKGLQVLVMFYLFFQYQNQHLRIFLRNSSQENYTMEFHIKIVFSYWLIRSKLQQVWKRNKLQE